MAQSASSTTNATLILEAPWEIIKTFTWPSLSAWKTSPAMPGVFRMPSPTTQMMHLSFSMVTSANFRRSSTAASRFRLESRVTDTDTSLVAIKSIAHNLKNLIITVTSPRMLQGHGFLARIFEVFGRHKISIDMIATSEVSVSVTLDSSRNLEAAVEDLRKFAEVTIEKEKCIICVVGDGIRSTPGIAGDVFQALKDGQVNVLMISQGASKINVAFVVEDADCAKAVQALHRKFFGV